jgi:dCTP deaminase
MSVLSNAAILSRLGDELPRRLVISPILDKKTQARIGQAAVDVRLGFHFCLVTASKFGTIDEFKGGLQKRSYQELYRREFVPLGAKIVIHPHQFLLAQTLEYIRLPPDLMAFVIGRSSWGRLGLIVATAVGIHPGFAGNLTLELRNLGETPLTLVPGQPIAQLFIQRVVGKDGEDSTDVSENSQYAGTVDMIPKRLSDAATFDTLRELIRRF